MSVSLHQIVARQELIGGKYAVEILPRYVHEARKAGSGADEHGREALPVEEAVYRDSPSDHHVGLYLHSKLQHFFYLGRHHPVLRKAELRDAILEHASSLVKSLEDSHFIAKLGKVGGTGKSCGAAAHDSHFQAV